MNETVNYCAVCRESFGGKFSFCPVCGESLKAVEVKKNEAFAAPKPNNARIQSEKTADVTLVEPIFESASQFVRQPLAPNANAANKALLNHQKSFSEPESNFKKLVITVEPPNPKPLEVVKPISKKSFHPTFVVAIVGILIIFGAAFALFNAQPSASQTTNSNGVEFESATDLNVTADSAAIAEKEILPQSTAEIQPKPQTVTQTSFLKEVKELGKKEKAVVAVSSKIPQKKVKVIKQKQNSVKLPLTSNILKAEQPGNNQRFERYVAVRQELSKQPEEVLVEKRKVKNANSKKTGFRGFFNKVGSGLLRIPKTIFKERKN